MGRIMANSLNTEEGEQQLSAISHTQFNTQPKNCTIKTQMAYQLEKWLLDFKIRLSLVYFETNPAQMYHREAKMETKIDMTPRKSEA